MHRDTQAGRHLAAVARSADVSRYVGEGLTSRRHVDLMRVSSSSCR